LHFEAAVEHCLGHHRARGGVIRMPVDSIRGGDHARTVTTYQPDGIVEMCGILADPPIGPAEIFAPRRAKHSPCFLGLLHALFRRSIGGHLAASQVAQADRVAERGVLGKRSPQADFQIIRVRSKRQQVNGCRVKPKWRSAGSISSRWWRRNIRLAR
jgi:hypothetical protein